MSSEAFVTSAINDDHALGALVLAQSIRQQCERKRKLVVLISKQLSYLIKKSLESFFDEVLVVGQLNSNDREYLDLLSQPKFGTTYTKINCWLLEQYSKCVFLDANCLVLHSIDDLFEKEEFSAAPDANWPDYFNSGVFVFQPSKQTFSELMALASQHNASFDSDDQRLLNSFFVNWRMRSVSRRLSFVYNVDINSFHSNSSLATQFRTYIRVIRFAGALRPWQLAFKPDNEQLLSNFNARSDIERDFLVSWWRTMHQHVSSVIQRCNQQSSSTNETIKEEEQFEDSFSRTLNDGNVKENERIESNFRALRQAASANHSDYPGNGTSIRSSLSTNNGTK